MCACIFVCRYTCVHACVWVHIRACVQVHMCVHTYLQRPEDISVLSSKTPSTSFETGCLIGLETHLHSWAVSQCELMPPPQESWILCISSLLESPCSAAILDQTWSIQNEPPRSTDCRVCFQAITRIKETEKEIQEKQMESCGDNAPSTKAWC